MRAQLFFMFVLWSRLAGRSVQGYEKWSFFKCFYQFWYFSPSLRAGWGVAYIRIEWGDKSATCSSVPSCFHFVWWSRLAERIAKTYEKRSFFSIFSHLDPFPKVFGQVKEWLLLELHKIKKYHIYLLAQLVLFCVVSKCGWEECSNL